MFPAAAIFERSASGLEEEDEGMKSKKKNCQARCNIYKSSHVDGKVEFC